jgi:putative component of membrane protein insertase Oxa1/YidC/SpoIIIJ protein YidD
MKYLILVVVLTVSVASRAQDKNADRGMLLQVSKQVEPGSNGFFKGLFSVYQSVFSDQILNDCIYEHSCSTFGQGALRAYGPVKGVFLTADRLMRCNRATFTQIAPVRINDEGKIRDHWEDYSFRADH